MANRQKAPRRNSGKKGKSTRILITVLLVLLFLILLAAAVFCILSSKGKKDLLKSELTPEIEITVPSLDVEEGEEPILEDDGKTVTYNGKRYVLNENITSILFLGIDKDNLEEGKDIVGNNGQADCIFLGIMDTQTGKVSLLAISRDSMVDINTYDKDGNFHGVENRQLCLAYAYGNGKATSCENVARSVSRLLYGMPIQSYAAIPLDAIADLNDAVGGVEVTIPEDSALSTDLFKPGQKIVLKGKQAQIFVQSRDTELLDSNLARMARQKQYLMNFAQKVLKATKEDLTIPLKLYQIAMDKNNMVTNVTVSKVSYLATRILDVDFSEENLKNVPGEVVKGEQYAEYHVDDAKLYEMILELFYVPEE